MGVVYLAYDELLDRRVALKLVKHSHETRAWQTRTLREAQALARVSHPNVVQVHDAGEFEHRVYLAMEYVDGVSLRRWLQAEQERSVRSILDIFMDVGRGLAAVHEAGLVHRDFKMENVLVDERGRARVADFGLAAARLFEPDPVPESEPEEYVSRPLVAALNLSLTTSGAVLGTPKTMAPEQFLGHAADARSDQFSFCVELYRALYGTPPFAGESFAELMREVTAGQLRAFKRARVPSWIEPILRRGLATDPEYRYPSMKSLLADLANDPVARRRQRLRTLAVVAGTAALVLAGVYGGRLTLERWRRVELEERASTHLARVEDEMTRLRGAGEHARADQLFDDLIELIEYRGTRALTDAWIRRAVGQARAGDHRAARLSLSRAYLEAPDPELAYGALVELTAGLVAEHRWNDAERAAIAAGELEAAAGEPSARLSRLGVDIALARLDFERASSLARSGPEDLHWLAPVASNLSRASPTEHFARGHMVPIRGGSERAWLVGKERVIVRLDRALTPVRPAPDGKQIFVSTYRPGSDQYAIGVVEFGGELAASTLYRIDEDGIEPVKVLDKHYATAIEVADLDGDTRDEIYVGGDSLTAMQQSADGTWQLWEPHPGSAGLECEVRDLQTVDLDEDGQEELIASCGEWDAYDVRVYEHDVESAQLRLRARRMLGAVKGLATLRRATGGRVVIAPKLEQYGNSRVFPPQRPMGGPPGVYLFRLEGDELVLDSRLELPPDADGDPVKCAAPLVADVDGDGRDDFFIRTWSHPSSSETRYYQYLFRQRADGSFSTHALGNIYVLAVADVDDDPALEWLVFDWRRDRSISWLGVGEPSSLAQTASPARDAERGPPVPAGVSPALARLWERSATLQELGLAAEAAEGFERIASLATSPALQRAAWTRAALQHTRRRAHVEAARLHELVAGVGGAPQASVEAARNYRRAGEYDAALRVLESHEGPGDALPGELVALRDHLHTLVHERRVVLDFKRGLPPGLSIERPLSLELVPERHVLRIQSHGERPLVSYPMRWDGREFMMRADVELRRGEYASTLIIELRRDGATSAPSLLVGGWGGAGGATYYFSTDLIASRLPQLLADRNGRWRLRIQMNYLANERLAKFVVLDRDTDEIVHEHRVDADDGLEAFQPGEYRLEIRARPDLPGVLEADLERLELVGATADAAYDARDAVARALVSGRPAEALRLLGPARDGESTRARSLRFVTLARLGRYEDAVRAASELLAAPDGEDAVRELLLLAPADLLPFVREAAGERAFAMLLDVWRERHMSNENVVGQTRALLPALADADAIEEPVVRAGLLEIRGDLRMREGDLANAREDLRLAHQLIGATERGELEIKLAALAAAVGDVGEALQYAEEVMSRAPVPSVAAAMLRARPELATLEGLAEWEALLGPDDRLLYDE